MHLTLSNLQRLTDKRLQQTIDLFIDCYDGDKECARLLLAALHIKQYRAIRTKMYRSWYQN